MANGSDACILPETCEWPDKEYVDAIVADSKPEMRCTKEAPSGRLLYIQINAWMTKLCI